MKKFSVLLFTIVLIGLGIICAQPAHTQSDGYSNFNYLEAISAFKLGDSGTTTINSGGVSANALSVSGASTLAGINTSGNIHQSGSTHTDLKDTTITGALLVSGALTRAGQTYTFLDGKAGATAGWAVRAGANLWHCTLPASQSSSTLVMMVSGLHTGDVITKMNLLGQVESGGNAVGIAADLRKLTAAAADLTDASVGKISPFSTTADAVLTSATAVTSTLNETVDSGETFYVLVTATTGASTDIDLQGVQLTVTQK